MAAEADFWHNIFLPAVKKILFVNFMQQAG
jgi:hypothetical protein